jgi:PTS system mannose-specific IID component
MSALTVRAPLFVRSFLLQAGFSDERRQGLGFAWAVDPALRAAYSANPDGLRAARARHLASFNVQPYAVGVPLGIVAALEARAPLEGCAAAERAEVLKSALSAALSGPADAFFWGALRPLAGALAVAVGAGGWLLGLRHSVALGAALGLIAFNAPALAARWLGLTAGLRDGETAAAVVAGLPVRDWIRGVRLAAAALVFAAAFVALGLPFVPRAAAAVAFAVGAGLSRAVGGPLRLIAAAGLLGMAASAAGWG